ncbi:hypothetical protein BRC81_03045 [Halobacteriales archaeon QS_1_68_20]|nr:MAG: hypothetical protein BRC81_03045 [Halobacteriales archaeon QS_1_68_20]
MSATRTSQQERVPADQRFREVLWENPEVCSNCFRRCKEVETLHPPEWGGGNYPTERHERTADGELGRDVETHDRHGALRTYPPRTTCGNCGSVRLLADHDSLSLEAAVGLVEPIADRLEEAGYEVDRQLMRKWVRVHKRTEAFTNYDREIFASAVQEFTDP